MLPWFSGCRYYDGKRWSKRKSLRKKTLQFYIIRENGTPLPLQDRSAFLWAVAVFVAVSLLSLAGTAWLASGVMDTVLVSERLENDLARLERQHTHLNEKKELLMAQVVVANERAGGKSRLASLAAAKPTQPTLDGNRTKRIEKGAVQATIKEEPVVDVRDFVISHDRQSKTVSVGYSLVNTLGKGEPVSGRAYVVLGETPERVHDIHRKRNRNNRLASGNPFSIQRFKRIEFRIADDILKKPYQSASVFVFTGNGELLLEKQWEVDIQSS